MSLEISEKISKFLNDEVVGKILSDNEIKRILSNVKSEAHVKPDNSIVLFFNVKEYHEGISILLDSICLLLDKTFNLRAEKKKGESLGQPLLTISAADIETSLQTTTALTDLLGLPAPILDDNAGVLKAKIEELVVLIKKEPIDATKIDKYKTELEFYKRKLNAIERKEKITILNKEIEDIKKNMAIYATASGYYQDWNKQLHEKNAELASLTKGIDLFESSLQQKNKEKFIESICEYFNKKVSLLVMLKRHLENGSVKVYLHDGVYNGGIIIAFNSDNKLVYNNYKACFLDPDDNTPESNVMVTRVEGGLALSPAILLNLDRAGLENRISQFAPRDVRIKLIAKMLAEFYKDLCTVEFGAVAYAYQVNCHVQLSKLFLFILKESGVDTHVQGSGKLITLKDPDKFSFRSFLAAYIKSSFSAQEFIDKVKAAQAKFPLQLFPALLDLFMKDNNGLLYRYLEKLYAYCRNSENKTPLFDDVSFAKLFAAALQARASMQSSDQPLDVDHFFRFLNDLMRLPAHIKSILNDSLSTMLKCFNGVGQTLAKVIPDYYISTEEALGLAIRSFVAREVERIKDVQAGKNITDIQPMLARTQQITYELEKISANRQTTKVEQDPIANQLIEELQTLADQIAQVPNVDNLIDELYVDLKALTQVLLLCLDNADKSKVFTSRQSLFGLSLLSKSAFQETLSELRTHGIWLLNCQYSDEVIQELSIHNLRRADNKLMQAQDEPLFAFHANTMSSLTPVPPDAIKIGIASIREKIADRFRKDFKRECKPLADVGLFSAYADEEKLLKRGLLVSMPDQEPKPEPEQQQKVEGEEALALESARLQR